MATVSKTSEYDPRYKRARTLEGAKARYVEEGNGYGIEAFKHDVERLLENGEPAANSSKGIRSYADGGDGAALFPDGRGGCLTP